MATNTVNEHDARTNYDILAKKLAQLHAMLTMTYGEALETLESMNETLRDNYLSACSDVAEDCGKLLASIPYPTARPLTINGE